MKLFLAFLVVVLCVCDAKKAKKESPVVSLSGADFDTFVASKDAVLVKFFAPWCGHCKALAPEYEKAATALKDVAVLAEVDCTQSSDLCGKFEIEGYPTVKFFQKDKDVIEYEGARKSETIVGWVKRMRLPAVNVFKTAEEAETLIDDSPVAAVAHFPSESMPEFKAFATACDSLRMSLTCVAVVGEKEPVELSIVRRVDDGKEKYTGAMVYEDILTWARSAVIPLIAEISQDNARTYVEASVPVGFLYIDVKSADFPGIRSAFVNVALQYRGKILFAYVDTNKFARMAKSVGLSGNTFPAFVIENPKKEHFVFKEGSPLEEKAVAAFVADVLDGKVAPTIRSQPVPEKQESDVYTIVGDTFKQVVNDPTKDVFVKFYAPWCGHCKHMKPDYEALAHYFAPLKDKILIAEIDATENDAPGFQIKGFPTLIFFPANHKDEPITYSSARTVDSMREFIFDNADLVTPDMIPGEVKPAVEEVKSTTEEKKPPVEKADEKVDL